MEVFQVYIAVVPESLDDLSSYLKRVSSDIGALERKLQNAMDSLDWKTRYQSNLEVDWNRARKLANNIIYEAEYLANFLSRKAYEFREADRQGASIIEQTGIKFNSLIHSALPGFFGAMVSYPKQRMNRIMRLVKYADSTKVAVEPFRLLEITGKSVVSFSTDLPVAASLTSEMERYASR